MRTTKTMSDKLKNAVKPVLIMHDSLQVFVKNLESRMLDSSSECSYRVVVALILFGDSRFLSPCKVSWPCGVVVGLCLRSCSCRCSWNQLFVVSWNEGKNESSYDAFPLDDKLSNETSLWLTGKRSFSSGHSSF